MSAATAPEFERTPALRLRAREERQRVSYGRSHHKRCLRSRTTRRGHDEACGVAQAANLAAGHPQIKALVLLSGLVPGSPMKYLATARGVAVFGASSTGDMGAGNVEDLARASKHPQSTAKHYPVGGAHGVGMFARDPELRPAIVQ